MPNYTDLPNEQLVAEVARRMPREKIHFNDGEILVKDGGLWLNWLPLENANDLDDVKREIERRKWNRRMWTSVRGSYYHTEIGFPDKLGEAHASTEPRAWLLAFLRATDAQQQPIRLEDQEKPATSGLGRVIGDGGAGDEDDLGSDWE